MQFSKSTPTANLRTIRAKVDSYTSVVFRSQSTPACLGGVGVCLLFALLRWHSTNSPLIRDEGEYAYAAQLLRHGGLPYAGSFLQKPPMVVYSYFLANFLLPHIFWAPRLLAALFVAATTGLLGYVARIEFGRAVALPAMLLFTPMVLLPGIDQYTANTEMFMLLPLLGTVGVCVYAREHGSNSRLWFVGGVLAGISLGFKYTALPVLAWVWLVWAARDWKKTRAFSTVTKHLGSSFLGVLIALAIVLAPFLIQDGGRRLWECTVSFNSSYLASSNFGPGRLWFRLLFLWRSWWLFFLLPVILLFRPLPRVWLWFGLFAAGWVSTGGSYYSQYYVPLTPFWAVLSAVALGRLSVWISDKLHRTQSVCAALLTGVALVALCLPDVHAMTRQGARLLTRNPLNPFPESAIVAQKVAQLTSQDEPVFIAGSEPQILYYARRFSPTRFVLMYPLMIPSPLAQNFQREAVRDLEKRPPALIVKATSNTSWLRQAATPPEFEDYLDHLLDQNYERVGGYVRGDASGSWVEPLPNKDVPQATLILFKIKNRAAQTKLNPETTIPKRNDPAS
jgi:hypothetical protein